MDRTAVCSVNTLDEPQRQAFESVVGSPLAPDQRVFILVYSPGAAPDEEKRRRAREKLDAIYQKADAHVAQLGVTQDEFDAAVDEAVENTRRRRPA